MAKLFGERMSDTVLNLCKALPNLPSDEDGPIFAEPWQAHVFALAIQLCDDGYFSWPEWVEAFSVEITNAQAIGDPDLGNTYYNHWLTVLEHLISKKGVLSSADMLLRKEKWRTAYLSTPHGQPVEL